MVVKIGSLVLYTNEILKLQTVEFHNLWYANEECHQETAPSVGPLILPPLSHLDRLLLVIVSACNWSIFVVDLS